MFRGLRVNDLLRHIYSHEDHNNVNYNIYYQYFLTHKILSMTFYTIYQ